MHIRTVIALAFVVWTSTGCVNSAARLSIEQQAQKNEAAKDKQATATEDAQQRQLAAQTQLTESATASASPPQSEATPVPTATPSVPADLFKPSAPGVTMDSTTIQYQGGLMLQDAVAIANALKEHNVTGGTAHTVAISKIDGEYHFGFMLNDGSWDNQNVVNSSVNLAQEISNEALSGIPINVHLCDHDWAVHKTLRVTMVRKLVTSGTNNTIWYSSDYSEQDALILGRTADSGNVKNLVIGLEKKEGSIILSVLIPDNIPTNDPKLDASLHYLARTYLRTIHVHQLTMHACYGSLYNPSPDY